MQRRVTAYLLGALMMLVVLAPAGLRAADSGESEKYVWLMDSRLDMPVARFRVPATWRVEGNVVWTSALPVSSMSVWIRMADQNKDLVYEAVQPVASFIWNKAWEGAAVSPIEGQLDHQSMLFTMRPRHAIKLLEEFVWPLVTDTAPDAKVVWARESDEIAKRAAPETEAAAAEFKKLPGAQVTSSGSGATMLVQNNGKHSIFSAVAISADVQLPNQPGLSYWNWQTLTVATAPDLTSLTPATFKDAFAGRLVINPEWKAKAMEQRKKEFNDYKPGNTWPTIDNEAYQKQATGSGELVERMVRPDESAASKQTYSNPDSHAVKVLPVTTPGYANSLVNTLVLGN